MKPLQQILTHCHATLSEAERILDDLRTDQDGDREYYTGRCDALDEIKELTIRLIGKYESVD